MKRRLVIATLAAFSFALGSDPSLLCAESVKPKERKALPLIHAVRLAMAKSPEVLLQKEVLLEGKGRTQEQQGVFDILLGAQAQGSKESQLLTALESQSANGANVYRLQQSGYGAQVGKKFQTGQSASFGVIVDQFDDRLLNSTSPTRGEIRLSFVQPILRGRGSDATTGPLQEAFFEEQARQYDLRRRVSLKVASTGQAYWDYLAAIKTLHIRKITEERASKRHADLQKLVEGGELPKTTLEQSSADESARKADRLIAEATLFLARQNLGIEMGIPYEEIPILPHPFDAFPKHLSGPVPSPLHIEKYIEHIYKKRNDLHAAKKRYAAAEALNKTAENAKLPKLDLELSTGYRSLHEDSGSDAYLDSLSNDLEGANVFVSLRYEFPVPNNSAHGLALQSQANLRQRSIERDELRRRIQSEVASAISNLLQSHEAYEETTKAVRRFQNALNNEMKKFQLQMSTLLDVQQVEEQLTQAMLQEVEASRAFSQALLSLRLATDTLVDFTEDAGSIEDHYLTTLPTKILRS